VRLACIVALVGAERDRQLLLGVLVVAKMRQNVRTLKLAKRLRRSKNYRTNVLHHSNKLLSFQPTSPRGHLRCIPYETLPEEDLVHVLADGPRRQS
jgi:hypothetical protein